MKSSGFFSRLLKTSEIGAWWDIRKIGFKKRLAVSSVVVISTTFYVVFLNPLMKILWLLVFLVSAELFTLIYTLMYIRNLGITLTYKKKTIQIDIPEEIVKLSDQIGCKINELRIQPDLNFHNAYVVGKTIVLGRFLTEKLNMDEVLAIVAHELGHIKENHLPTRFLLLLGASFSTLSWWNLPVQILMIAALAYFTIVMIPLNWIIEYRADKFAMKFVGNNHLRSALLKIVEGKNLKEPSEDHPSIFNRLKLMK